MEYQWNIDPGIEANGSSISATVDAFQQYPSVVTKYLLKYGLISNKQAQIDRSAWYPLNKWLEAYQAIAKEVGVGSLYAIGKRVPENALLPPQITDIRSLFAAIDISYHLNHRKNGIPMYDVATGEMMEEIGHYICEFVKGEQKLTLKCESPWPCDLDRGIMQGFASRFEPNARVVHDNSAPCRKKGASSCTLLVAW